MNPMFSRSVLAGAVFAAACFPVAPALAETPAGAPAAAEVMPVLAEVLQFLQPPAGEQSRAFSATLTVREATGSLKMLAGARAEVWLQMPERAVLTVHTDDQTFTLGRNPQALWIHAAHKKLLVIGEPGVPRFASRPDSVKPDPGPLLRLPPGVQPLALLPALPALVSMTRVPGTDGATDYQFQPTPGLLALKLPVPAGTFTASVPEGSDWPSAFSWQDGSSTLRVEMSERQLTAALPDSAWQPAPATGDTVEHVALSHLTDFLETAVEGLVDRIPTLPAATGRRTLVATAGAGRLEDHDGTRVLFLAGTPEEMGRQQGTLLKPEVRRVTRRILYGVGVGSSFDKGRWFFSEIEEAVRRTSPFIEPRHLAEMDALADAAGMDREEVHLSNFFPELFHCSGFALLGKSTTGGRIFHGRVLDYLRGAGLEQNAVVIVSRPDKGNAWVNIGYAGFTGSVTAMNEKQLSIGEMGGRGEGNWDGKPMAQLVREVMESCSTLDEALDFMRRTPRTCEYYYVVADAKSHRAVGIKATPDAFEVVHTGEGHPELSDPVEDTVLLSAGDRYKELVKRVKDGYGTFEAESAIQLMTRPVCMTSNIHSALFAPDTLDFWVANADEENPASHTRFTHYNLRELLDGPPAPKVAGR